MENLFLIRRFLHDFEGWEKSQIEQVVDGMTSTSEVATYLTGEKPMVRQNQSQLALTLSAWKDISMEGIVKTLRKERVDVKQALLFFREHQERYLTRSYQIRCPKKHVIEIPHTNAARPNIKSCPTCNDELPENPKLKVVYNWKMTQKEDT